VSSSTQMRKKFEPSLDSELKTKGNYEYGMLYGCFLGVTVFRFACGGNAKHSQLVSRTKEGRKDQEKILRAVMSHVHL